MSESDRGTDAGDLGPNVRRTPAGKATGEHTDTLLRTDGLVKRFGGSTATDSLEFAVDEGELRCLIGPNGAGKSTLLKLITGAYEPTAGQIHYDGHDITDLDPHERVRRGISMKFQVPSVYGDLTVRENVRLPVQHLLDGDERRRRIEEALAAAGLSVEERERIADRVTRLNDEGTAFVVIEHDTDFVAEIADKVTVLHRGDVFREGSVEEIERDPEVRRIYLGENGGGQ